MSFLAFKNKLIPEAQINVMQVGRLYEPRLSDKHLEDAVSFPSYFYATNNLVVTLTPEEDETELFNLFWTPEGGVTPVKAWAFWKTTNSDTTFERGKYKSFGAPEYTPVKLISVSSDRTRLEIEINESFISSVEAFYSAAGIDKPEFGFLALQIPFGKITGGRPDDYKIYLFKYTHNPVFSTPSIVSPDDPEVVKNSYTSSPRTYENLFVPRLSASFHYNEYIVTEGSYDFAARQRYQGVPINKIPKYVKLSWRPAPPIVKISDAGLVAPSETVETKKGETSTDAGLETGDVVIAGEDSVTEPEDTRTGMHIGGIFFSGEDSLLSFAGTIMTSETTKTSEDASTVYDVEGGDSILGSGGGGDSIELESDTVSALDPFSTTSKSKTTLSERTKEKIEDTKEAYTAKSGYVGYVILKERILEDETVEPLDLIVVSKRNVTNWIDWKVAYGETYRYKIRSVYKFINKKDLPMFADSDAILSRSGSAEAFDSSVLFKSAHYFDSQYSSPATVRAIDTTPPDPPHNFKLYPNSKKKRIFLSWNQKQQTKDVIGYNVYRRAINEERFKRLNGRVLDRRNNFFIDRSLEVDRNYIYAVESVDRHANRSNLSVQYIANIKPYNIQFEELCEDPIRLWASQGLKINENPKKDPMEKITFSNGFKTIINPFFNNLEENTTYLLKITSLDTFQEKEIKLKFKTKVINHRSRLPLDTGADTELVDEEGRLTVTRPKIKGGLGGLGF